MQYVFGPVLSRRLGRSLGVDLIPSKTCVYDCVYCQLGCTTRRTTARREWTPVNEVLAEVARALDRDRPDYITLAGSGEPTLHAGLGAVVAGIKALCDVPVAVLTNGALLGCPDVQRDLLAADVVIPSLDAGDAPAFAKVNRPDPAVRFAPMVEGLAGFRSIYSGAYWLEVLLLAGVTDTEEQVRKIAACARRIRPDRVQLNTVTRPSAEGGRLAVPHNKLEALTHIFHPPAEVVADFPDVHTGALTAADPDAVIAMTRRHPCTAADLEQGLGLSQATAQQCLDALLEQGAVEVVLIEGRAYYQPKRE